MAQKPELGNLEFVCQYYRFNGYLDFTCQEPALVSLSAGRYENDIQSVFPYSIDFAITDMIIFSPPSINQLLRAVGLVVSLAVAQGELASRPL